MEVDVIMKKILSRFILISIIITLAVIVLMFARIFLFETIENQIHDYAFQLRGKVKPPDNIVIAAIDEKSISTIGAWPWSRDKIANLITKLHEAGAQVIDLDIIFSESTANDIILAQSIQDANNVILPIVFSTAKEKAPYPYYLENLQRSALTSVTSPERFERYSPISSPNILEPVLWLIDKAHALGHINIFPDRDGVIRWTPLIIAYKGYLYTSTSLQAVALYMKLPRDKIILKATEGIQIGQRFISTDHWGRVMINYYGPKGTFKHISVADILEGRIAHDLLRGRIVIVGATAPILHDELVTPVSSSMNGAEMHANFIASMLEGKTLSPASSYLNAGIIAWSGLMVLIFSLRLTAVRFYIMSVLLLLLILIASYFIFTTQGIIVSIFYPSVNVFLLFVNVIVNKPVIIEKGDFAEILPSSIRRIFSLILPTILSSIRRISPLILPTIFSSIREICSLLKLYVREHGWASMIFSFIIIAVSLTGIVLFIIPIVAGMMMGY